MNNADYCGQNILINNDNLMALKELENKFKNKIGLINIDPPYNTGKMMGRYNDNFGDHEHWALFMQPRLEIARELLNDSGSIWVHIGEDEYCTLKILMEKVFGKDNYVQTIVWQSKYTVANDKKKGISRQTEYIIVFAKNIKLLTINNDQLDKEYVKKCYANNLDNDTRGPWRLGVQLYKKKNKKSYTVVSPTGKKWTMPWNYSEERWHSYLEAENLIWWGHDGNSCPTKKVFLKKSKGKPIGNLWLGKDVGFSADGGIELEKLIKLSASFLYPKPIKLIKRIITIAAKKDSIVLDFFAGTGTVGQAVVEKNLEDKGNRKFILINNNENNIFDEILVPRLNAVKAKEGINLNWYLMEINRTKCFHGTLKKRRKYRDMKGRFIKFNPKRSKNGKFARRYRKVA